MSKGKILLGLGLAAFAGLVAWAVMTVPEPPPPAEEAEKPLVMSYEGNTLSGEKDGRKIWDMTAASIVLDADAKSAELTDILAHFYAQDGRVVEARAAHGSYDQETRDIAIDGAVKITTSDGAALSCDRLAWTAAEGRLAAIGNARASKDDMQAEGERIESTDGFNRIRIQGGAHLVKGAE